MNHTARLEQAHGQLLAARNEEERQEAQHTFTEIFFEPFAQDEEEPADHAAPLAPKTADLVRERFPHLFS